jgi:lipopolysaccharide transport system ATP-binding protein
VVRVQNVSKLYHLYRHPSDRLRELILPGPGHKRHEFWALRDITFQLERGEVLGLIGPNGSGKSTLLQIVAGILQPTAGRVVTQGRVAALLELGAGFNPEFTGRENVFLNGEIMGLSRAEVERAMPAIEAFADIGDFIHRPVKEYSTGMYVRLAFATAIHVEPDILIVDEALAVGDAVFANRCIRKFEELRKRHVTVLFVSHDLGLVKHLSQRAILLVNGAIRAQGDASEVTNRYIGLVLERQRRDEEPDRKPSLLRSERRHGDGISEISQIEILDALGNPTRLIQTGDEVTVRVRARFRHPSPAPMIGILMRTRIGMDVFGTNTQLEGIDLGPAAAGETLTLEFRMNCWLTPQEYTLTAASQNIDGTSQDWLDDAVAFEVVGRERRAGVVDLRPRIHWHKETA